MVEDSQIQTEDFSNYNGPGTELRKAQLCMVEILKEIGKVCKRHNIAYWLDFGTLLGAVRHQGFIPWDDDADITIFKRDARRLEKFLLAELPERYYVFSRKTDKKYRNTGYFRIVDKKTQMLKPGQDETEAVDYGNGVSVDIFNIERGHTWFKRAMNVIHGRAIRRIHNNIDDGLLNKTVSYIIFPFTWFVILLYRIVVFILPEDRYIYNIPNCVVKQMFSQRRKKYILPLNTVTFEGCEFPAPCNAHEMLKETYGDYMQIPPKEKRATHGIFIKVLD
ncbi:MAG: LicD family protein [Bacteroidaceae bacterium]|nr:LicD family protein [Bacteroidaceae bacterium]